MCDLCPSGTLPTRWVSVFIPECPYYGRPTSVTVDVVVQGSDDAELSRRRQVPLGPFDTTSDVVSIVRTALEELYAELAGSS